MKNEIFEQLKKAIKRDSSDTNLQQVSFVAKHCNYELNFYADEEDNHILVIEHCGYDISNKWYEEVLCLEQENELQEIINNEVDIIEQNIKEEQRESNFDGDSYESTGTSQSDFY